MYSYRVDISLLLTGNYKVNHSLFIHRLRHLSIVNRLWDLLSNLLSRPKQKHTWAPLMHYHPTEAEPAPTMGTEEVVLQMWGDPTLEQWHWLRPHSCHPSQTQAHHPHPGKCHHLHHQDLHLTHDLKFHLPLSHLPLVLWATHVPTTSHCWRTMVATLLLERLELRQFSTCTTCGQSLMEYCQGQAEPHPLPTT